jgi:hypothetical protein
MIRLGYPETQSQIENKGSPDITASDISYWPVGTTRVGADEKGGNLG